VIPAFAFLYGAVIGSFLNVCILRLPEGKSVVTPRSACPRCGSGIAAYDNIPIFSWLILRGRCRNCQEPISPLYPTIELITGVLFLIVASRYGLSCLTLKLAIFSAILVVLVVTDWRERILPDKVNFPGLAVGLAFSLFVPVGDGLSALLAGVAGLMPLPTPLLSFADAVLGAIVGGGLLYGIGELYYLLRHQEGMGFGDVKMMTMVGTFLGPQLTLFTIFFASVLGALIGGSFMLVSKKAANYELPFGTFLGVAAWIAALWGRPLVSWYLGLFG
jgi:leader peptidase (prepilin peptidase) / N-methyltransferase